MDTGFFFSFPFQSTAEVVSNGELPHSLYSISRGYQVVMAALPSSMGATRMNSVPYSFPGLTCFFISDPAPNICRNDRLALDLALDVGLRSVPSACLCYRCTNGTKEPKNDKLGLRR